MQNRRGFTLIELLVVIAIIAILAAMLFPVFATARRFSKNAGCLSNLKQIALGVSLYQRDWTDLFPHGLDPADYYALSPEDFYGSTIEESNRIREEVRELQGRPNRGGMLDVVMKPYIANPKVWCCPSDTGISFLNLATSATPIDSKGQTCYEAFHMSYGYQTILTLERWRAGTLASPATTNVFMDFAGYWHTRYHRGARADMVSDVADSSRWSYNMLCADGHCANVDQETFNRAYAQ